MAEQSKTVDSALSLLALVAGTDGSPTAAARARTSGLSRTAVARGGSRDVLPPGG